MIELLDVMEECEAEVERQLINPIRAFLTPFLLVSGQNVQNAKAIGSRDIHSGTRVVFHPTINIPCPSSSTSHDRTGHAITSSLCVIT